MRRRSTSDSGLRRGGVCAAHRAVARLTLTIQEGVLKPGEVGQVDVAIVIDIDKAAVAQSVHAPGTGHAIRKCSVIPQINSTIELGIARANAAKKQPAAAQYIWSVAVALDELPPIVILASCMVPGVIRQAVEVPIRPILGTI